MAILSHCGAPCIADFSLSSGERVSQALSPVGRCQTFEATADGYGRGEGFVALLLQSPASRSRDEAEEPAPALAVVRGSAVNQDGRSSSLTAPNGPSQQVRLPQPRCGQRATARSYPHRPVSVQACQS